MEKVYQVFVSSTYSDLKDERRRVSDTLSKAGFIAAGMELFPASDQQQLDFIKRVIDRSDYYVVIVGARYGSLADDRISFTEKEYEYAKERKIPVLAFLHKNPDEIAVGKTDQNEEKAEQLKRFRNKLATGRMVDFWTNANDLCTTVTISVVNAANLTPGVGWVRGDQAIDPKVVQEFERTRAENEALKAKLADYERGELAFPAHLVGPDEHLSVRLSYRIANQPQILETEGQTTSRYLFETVVDAIIREISERLIGESFAKAYLTTKLPAVPRFVAAKVHDDDLKQLRFHLEALGLIKAESRQGPTSKYIAWTITEKGRQFISTARAIQKS